VDKKFRVAEGRTNRAIMGLSMGGRHAIKTGLGHLELFAYVGEYSAPAIPDFTTRFKDLLADPAGTNAKLKLLWIGCGRQDSLFGATETLANTLSAAKINHIYAPSEGQHDYFYWRRCFIETTAKLFQPEGKVAGSP
jgi:enterochelin esterase family protein